ncbi:MAG: glutathione S-transferase N-terminal domain-containing protein [Bradymonadia bacterium]
MIDLYSFNTPNGRKISIMLEELGVPYNAHLINILEGDQLKPEFLAISPNNKIPAIVDSEGPGGEPLALFETGAILVYLAEKYGKLLPTDGVGRARTLQWLFWQVGGVGPMFGQAGHFVRFAPEDVPYAKTRYTNETKRLLGVMDTQLAANAYLAGADFTIADIATVTWVEALDFYGIYDLVDDFPAVKAWVAKVKDRPGVKKGWDADFGG